MPSYLDQQDYSQVPTSQLDKLIKAIQTGQGAQSQIQEQAPNSVETSPQAIASAKEPTTGLNEESPGYFRDPKDGSLWTHDAQGSLMRQDELKPYNPTWRDSVAQSPTAQHVIGALRGFLEPPGVTLRPDLHVDTYNPFNDKRTLQEKERYQPRLDSPDPALRQQAEMAGPAFAATLPLAATKSKMLAAGPRAAETMSSLMQRIKALYQTGQEATPIVDQAGNAVRWGKQVEDKLAASKQAIDAVTGGKGVIVPTSRAAVAAKSVISGPVRAISNYVKNPMVGKAKVGGLEAVINQLTQPTARDRMDAQGNPASNTENDISASSESTPPNPAETVRAEAGATAPNRDRLAMQIQEAFKNDRKLQPYDAGKRNFWERLDRTLNPITARKNDQQMQLENTRQQLLSETPSPSTLAQVKALDEQIRNLDEVSVNKQKLQDVMRNQTIHSYAPAMNPDIIEQQLGLPKGTFDKKRLSEMGKSDQNAALMQILGMMGMGPQPQQGNPQIKLNPPKNKQQPAKK